ncbi:MAG TPA: RHS repeat-associated core domain-containing protein [Flavobacterium sp.]|nr:RHS repeat-associated core domain-containing protein [Flavobacterium sp.]
MNLKIVCLSGNVPEVLILYASIDKDIVCVDEDCYEVGIDIVPPQRRKLYQYKYNHQEWQDELDLNVYTMDWRQYDPAIARWTVMDPVIHHPMSPYNAFDNNPVYWADPSGGNSISSALSNLFSWENRFHYNWDSGTYSMFGKEFSSNAVASLLETSRNTDLTISLDPENSTGNGGGLSGGGNEKGTYTIKNGSKVVKDTGKAAQLIDALDKSLGENSKLFGKIGKIGGWMSMGGEVVYDGIEYYDGGISGYRFSFRLGSIVASTVIAAEVGTAIGGPFGFVAGTIIGFTAATIESAWDTWFPQFRASVNNFYNNIIYNISRYH